MRCLLVETFPHESGVWVWTPYYGVDGGRSASSAVLSMLLSRLEASAMDEARVVLRVDVVLLLQSFLDRLVEGKGSLHGGSIQELHGTLWSASDPGHFCLMAVPVCEVLHMKLALVLNLQDAVDCKCILLA